jgi:hypothetical protein
MARFLLRLGGTVRAPYRIYIWNLVDDGFKAQEQDH